MTNLGLVIAEFNRGITERMEGAAEQAAAAVDATIVERIYVPGSYDTPLAADRLARQPEIDAVAVIGSIITGETDHDQVIGQAAANGLSRISLERDTPVTFGIAGPGMTPEQARDRVDYGARAVESAVALVEGPG